MSGAFVVRSNNAAPGCIPASTPSGPDTTCSTSVGPGRQMNTTSLLAANSRGVAAQAAPAVRNGSAASRRLACTVREN